MPVSSAPYHWNGVVSLARATAAACSQTAPPHARPRCLPPLPSWERSAEGRVRGRPRAVASPLLQEPALVLSRKRRGVDAGTEERVTAIVMHKGVAGDHGPIARRDRPQAVIVIVEPANAVLLVER
jgi:hypothetical protein